jgi:hypothetical protein
MDCPKLAQSPNASDAGKGYAFCEIGYEPVGERYAKWQADRLPQQFGCW